jgi:hypothetical protein
LKIRAAEFRLLNSSKLPLLLTYKSPYPYLLNISKSYSHIVDRLIPYIYIHIYICINYIVELL